MDSVAIYLRRMYVYELFSRGLTTTEIKDSAARVHGCHTRTVARDINTMKEWLPEITKFEADATEIQVRILATLQLAQRALFNLGETAASGSARVGAYKAAINALFREAEFLFQSGIVEKVPDKVEVKKHEWSLSELIEEYADVLPEALEAYTKGAREEDARRNAKENIGKSVVPKEE